MYRRLAFLGLLLLAFAFRVTALAEHNLWWDEGIGVWLARLPTQEIVRWTAGDVHPPLYYVLLRGWWLIVGDGEYLLRYPSVLASLLTVVVIFRLGRELGGWRAGMIAALLLALSRFSIAWAQEIRMYALASLLATGVLLAAVRAWRMPDRWSAWLAYVLLSLGSLFSLYLTASVVLVANAGFGVVWWLRRARGDAFGRWIAAQLAVAVLYTPWALYALPRMHAWSSESSFSTAFFVQLYATMLATGSPIHIEAYLPFTLAAMAATAVGLIALLRTRLTAVQKGGLAMLLAGLIFPAVVVYIISLPIFGFYFSRPLVPRYLLPLASCFYAVAGWGGVAIQARAGGRSPWASWIAICVCITAAFSGLYPLYSGRARRDDYVSISHVLKTQRRPSDVVLLYVDRDWPVFAGHYPGSRHDVPYGSLLSAAATDALLAPFWAQAEGVWLVSTPEALQTDPERALPAWLETHAVAWETWVSGETALTFYARTPERAHLANAIAPGAGAPWNVQAEVGGGFLAGAWTPLPRYGTGDTLRLAVFWAPPPAQTFTVIVGGVRQREIRYEATAPDGSALQPVRQQIDIPLSPELPSGLYTIGIQAGNETLHVGSFRLFQRVAGTQIDPADIPHRTDYRLGTTIRLLGYALPKATVPPGGNLDLTLYWQTSKPLAQRYKVFTHLRGDVYNATMGNFLWGQQDNEPGNGQLLTTLWVPGTVIADTYRIPVDPAAPAGIYRLEVGLYGLLDGVRLPVNDRSGPVPDDAILLARIQVEP